MLEKTELNLTVTYNFSILYNNTTYLNQKIQNINAFFVNRLYIKQNIGHKTMTYHVRVRGFEPTSLHPLRNI